MYKTLLNYKEKLGSLLEALPIKESYLATGPLASSIMSRSPGALYNVIRGKVAKYISLNLGLNYLGYNTSCYPMFY